MQVQSLGWEGSLERKWQPTPIFLPGKSHGQRSLEGYSAWGVKRLRHDLNTKQQQAQERGMEESKIGGGDKAKQEYALV